MSKISESEQRKGAREFVELWQDRGDEKSDTQSFWRDLLHMVFGINDPTRFIDFEKRTKLDNVSFVDASIPLTKVLIEQKSITKDLTKSIKQSDGSKLTPFEQAKRYSESLTYSEKPRWIVTCNFKTFHVYDIDEKEPNPHIIQLANFEKEFHRLDFLVKEGEQKIIEEMEVSFQAGEIIKDLYQALKNKYINPESKETQQSLNKLCVRLVFLLYAEDAGLFRDHLQFHDYLQKRTPDLMRGALLDLFTALNTPEEKRSPYLIDDLKAFPYVNGGLFALSENDEIPQLDEEIANLILVKASEEIDWSDISPTIFGAIFESTLNPITRHDGGMHYTSIENIHKVTKPLFLDALYKEFDEIKNKRQSLIAKQNAWIAFQEKISNLVFLDPACGSGNFLTQTYLDLRRLENKVVLEYTGGQQLMAIDEFNPIKVNIHQFYGIEINDFAVTVAKTALWIAEAKVFEETKKIIKPKVEFFPLKSYANIHEGNALAIDWNEVIPKEKLNFIIGNPPFLGYSLQSEEQRNDIKNVFCSSYVGIFNQKVDYVSGWFYKSADFIHGTNIQCGFVASNSICQGEQPPLIWKPMFEQKNIKISFAYTTFIWDSKATDLAHVHCVIIGFESKENANNLEKTLFIEDGNKKICKNINSYLLDGPSIFIESRTKPVNNVPLITKGNQPTDGGNLIIEEKDYNDFLKKEPSAQPYIKLFLGAHEFLHNQKRYCLWFNGINTELLMNMPLVSQRLKNIRDIRSKSPKKATQDDAKTPWLFQEIRQPKSGNYLMIPSHSSENRKYMPMGFLPACVIASNAALIIPDISLFHFGILQSNVHMAWMRAFCGRLESRYRYSANIVYNNFPWPNVSKEQKAVIEKKAKAILDARDNHKKLDLATMYGDQMFILSDLVEAHEENDKAVMEAYGFDQNLTEAEIVSKLMELYVIKAQEADKRELANATVTKIWGAKNTDPRPQWLEDLRQEYLNGKISAEDFLSQGKAKLKAEKAAARKAEKEKEKKKSE